MVYDNFLDDLSEPRPKPMMAAVVKCAKSMKWAAFALAWVLISPVLIIAFCAWVLFVIKIIEKIFP